MTSGYVYYNIRPNIIIRMPFTRVVEAGQNMSRVLILLQSSQYKERPALLFIVLIIQYNISII